MEKIYGAENIKRHCNEMLKYRDHRDEASTSIADHPHKQSREQQRRLRQKAKRESR